MTRIEIRSAQNPRVKHAAKLRSSRGRKQQGRILIEGARELLRAVESGVEVEEVFFEAEQPLEGEAAEVLARLPDSTQRLCTAADVWGKLAVRGRDAMLLAVARSPSVDLGRLPFGDAVPLVLVVESVEKPGNLGALLRTADAAGVTAVLVADPACDVHNPNCIRASLGAVFTLPVAVCSAAEASRLLAEQGLQVLTTQVDAARNYWEADFTMPTALVVGSEAAGVSAQWRGADCLGIRLPMAGKVDSLNVSAAAAAVLYEALRQRVFRA